MTLREMSSSDFRAHLYQSLQGSGILSSMKSQLRNRMALELHKTIDGSRSCLSPSKSPRKSMRVQVADSMVAEYLKESGYQYSLSIFLPEADITIEKLISEEDLLSYLRIPPSSNLHRHFQSQSDGAKGSFLEKLLEALIASWESPAAVSSPAATPHLKTPPPPHIPSEPSVSHQSSPTKKSLTARLEELDSSYARKAEQETLKCQLSLEDRLLSFQRDLEARYKQQLETELALHRTREVAQAKQEERERYQEELAKEREALHRTHQMKLEEVKRTEQQLSEKYRRKEQELEAGIYSQRQSLLEELSALRLKEGRLRREMELDKKEVDIEKERAKTASERLEASLKQMKTQVEAKAEEKMQQWKTEFELSVKSRQSELDRREAQLKIDLENVELLKLENKKLAGELTSHRKSVDKLQVQLQESTWNQIGLQKQKDETQMKQVQFADYHQLKQKIIELKKQLSHAESKYSEAKSGYKQQQHLIKQLQARLTQPNMELLSLQAEVERLRKAHHREMLVMEFDNKQLSRHLATQTEHSHQLQRRLDEQFVQLRSAQREVEDMQSLLEHAYPRAATTTTGHGVPRKEGKEKATSKGGVSSLSKKPPRFSSSTQQPLPSQLPNIPSHINAENRTYPLDPSPVTPDWKKGGKSVSFFDTSGAFLAESRATIDRMEKEAKELERTYKDYHYSSLPQYGESSRHTFSPSLLPWQPSDTDVYYPSLYGQYRTSTVATPSTFHSPLSLPVQTPTYSGNLQGILLPGTLASFTPSPPPASSPPPPPSQLSAHHGTTPSPPPPQHHGIIPSPLPAQPSSAHHGLITSPPPPSQLLSAHHGIISSPPPALHHGVIPSPLPTQPLSAQHGIMTHPPPPLSADPGVIAALGLAPSPPPSPPPSPFTPPPSFPAKQSLTLQQSSSKTQSSFTRPLLIHQTTTPSTAVPALTDSKPLAPLSSVDPPSSPYVLASSVPSSSTSIHPPTTVPTKVGSVPTKPSFSSSASVPGSGQSKVSSVATKPFSSTSSASAPGSGQSKVVSLPTKPSSSSASAPGSGQSKVASLPTKPSDSAPGSGQKKEAALPTKSSSSSTSAPSSMSLDSWWKPAASNFHTRTIVGEIAVSQASTVLTDSVRAPILSESVQTPVAASEKEDAMTEEVRDETVIPAAAAQNMGEGALRNLQDMMASGDRETESSPPAESIPELSSGEGSGGPGTIGEAKKEELKGKDDDDDDDDGIDPVMLKYMQLVKEKRQEQETKVAPSTESPIEEEVLELSQEDVGGGFDDFNHNQDDPFENW